MNYDIRETSDTGDAYEAIEKALIAFNQKTVGNASGDAFALTISAPDSDEIVGGVWGMALWHYGVRFTLDSFSCLKTSVVQVWAPS